MAKERELSKEELEKIMKDIEKELPKTKVKTEEKQECYHKVLHHVGGKTAWYQCRKCKNIYQILNAAVYRDKEALKGEFDAVIKDTK